jgi:hypothetical protein
MLNMNDAETTKYWALTETLLLHASNLLHQPETFNLVKQDFAGYR